MCSECGNLTLGAVFREIGRQPTEGNGRRRPSRCSRGVRQPLHISLQFPLLRARMSAILRQSPRSPHIIVIARNYNADHITAMS
jgi:hypothetical protein